MSSYNVLKLALDASFVQNASTTHKCERALIDLNNWIAANLEMYKEHSGALLLNGALSASVEIMSTVRIGLLRQSIFAARNYYELIVAWIYYKDHPIEWARVEACKDQMMLPGEVKRYLRKSFLHFESRWGVLSACKKRSLDEPYDVMSAVVHGNVSTALPNATYPKEIVASMQALQAIIGFVDDLSEYLSDMLTCSFGSNWDSLPDYIQKSLVSRLPANAAAQLFFD